MNEDKKMELTGEEAVKEVQLIDEELGNVAGGRDFGGASHTCPRCKAVKSVGWDTTKQKRICTKCGYWYV